MITLHLTRNSETDGVYLKLPSTPAEIGEEFELIVPHTLCSHKKR